MLSSVFYKEFLKIRFLWLTLLALNAVLLIYIYIGTRQLFIMDHAEIVWYQVMHLTQIHYRLLKFAPLLTGMLLAGIQYLPEMAGERLRLSLHLPVSLHRLILWHILVGLTAVTIISGMHISALSLITATFFPGEAVWTALWTALPWCLAGIAAYLGVTLGLLEPSYRLKLFNLAVSAGVTGFFLRVAEPGGYVPVLIPLLALLSLMIHTVLLPAYHFRYRRVS